MTKKDGRMGTMDMFDPMPMPAGRRQTVFDAEDVVRAVGQSVVMPDERKLDVLRRFRDELGAQVVAVNLRDRDLDTAEVLRALMTEETDIGALGKYARTAAFDEQKRFGKEVYAALERVSNKGKLSSDDLYGAQLILEGCAAYQLAGSGKLADRFLSADTAVSVRIAAAQVSATLGGDRNKAINILGQLLNNQNIEVRKQTSASLSSIECLTDDERSKREAIILTHLGHPTEDYAIRVLGTCAGEKTSQQLLPVLDEPDVPRAVYAAWVLARHPDETVRQTGLRRVAIYGMFHHQIYQQGEGIDFVIAPGLDFHQVTGYLNRNDPGQRSQAVRIPDDLLLPFEFNQSEQDFAIRAYRYTRFGKTRHDGDFPIRSTRHRRDISWDASHLGLFEVIATEDPELGILHVKGEKVAHFKNRKAAAEIIANITQAASSYVGLDGETIDSQQTPTGPYENQNQLVASYLLDLAQKTRTESSGPSPYNNQRLERMIRNLVNELGDELKKELITQSVSRKIAEDLKESKYSVWRNYK